MGFAKSYFDIDPEAPDSLSVQTTRRVRFEDVDMLNIVWHGNYVSYLDDGRVAFGDRYPALSYTKMRQERTVAPVVQFHIDYLSPLHFDEEIIIITSLHWCDALKLNFEYRIEGPGGRVAARAYTVQLLTDTSGKMLLLPPGWVSEFRDNWRDGKLG